MATYSLSQWLLLWLKNKNKVFSFLNFFLKIHFIQTFLFYAVHASPIYFCTDKIKSIDMQYEKYSIVVLFISWLSFLVQRRFARCTDSLDAQSGAVGTPENQTYMVVIFSFNMDCILMLAFSIQWASGYAILLNNVVGLLNLCLLIGNIIMNFQNWPVQDEFIVCVGGGEFLHWYNPTLWEVFIQLLPGWVLFMLLK